MASILRQIVAGPRARHPEARLDLCYVTDNIIVTSGPSSVWPKKAYRNPTDQLVAFLDKKHGDKWAVFEFRAEGTGYPDSEVYDRIHHFPWPDHHPPPFAIIPHLMAAMRNWLQESEGRVAVIHCKAGKGRSGTSTCSYLISEKGWKQKDALQRFTERRMRAGFGQGVSIPSQLRWVDYVDRWTNKMNKMYNERPVEIVEIHIWGLRDGVKVSVEGFMDEGRRIHCCHTFTRGEKTVVDGPKDRLAASKPSKKNQELLTSPVAASPLSSSSSFENPSQEYEDVILKATDPIQLPTSDMNVDFERRNQVKYTGYTMVTSIAHVWFNAWFEGGYEGAESGVFEIDWEAMDGIKGSARKGIKSFDKIKVVWRYTTATKSEPVPEPAEGEPVKEGHPADWKHDDSDKENEARHSDGLDSNRVGGAALTMGSMIAQGAETLTKELGLRKSNPDSANVSRASSEQDVNTPTSAVANARYDATKKAEDEDFNAVKTYDPEADEAGESQTPKIVAEEEGRADTTVGHTMEKAIAAAASVVAKVKGNHDDQT